MDTEADKKAPSGSEGKASGDAETNVSQVMTQEEARVSRESYLKAVDEAKSAKRRLREYEEAKLKQENDLKGILEIREKELGELRSWKAEVEQRELLSKKTQAFKSVFKTPIEDKWLRLVDMNNILVDPSSGTIDPRSVELEARRFEKEWPVAFQRPTPGAQINSPAAVSVTGALTYEEWLKLPLKEQLARRKEVMSNESKT